MNGIYLFSFNRGKFLQNCIHSIETCLPGLPLTIVDDRSTDSETVAVLQDVGVRHEVVYTTPGGISEHKTGGLSAGMNLAMSLAQAQGHEHVLFLQDDMQVVRPFLAEDHRRTVDYFNAVPNTIQVSTNFCRTLSSPGFFDNFDANSEASSYIRKTGRESGKSGFSATGVFSVSRFFGLFESFEVGEYRNSRKAIQRGLVCGRSMYPFTSWLPYPTSYRGRSRSLTHQLFEHFGRSGFHPIETMDESAVRSLLNRDVRREPPLMEVYLRSPTAPRSDIWSTGGGEYNFLAYGSVLARVYTSLRRVKHKFVPRL